MKQGLRKVISSVGLLPGTAAAAALILGGAWALHGQQQSNFTGGNPTRVEDTAQSVVVHLRFPPGVRSKWHSHEAGQIVFVEEGVGLVQERGGPIIELHAGETIYAKPGVVHWHGAAPDRGGVQLNVTRGNNTWLEEVSEKDYNGPTKRLAPLPQ
jgi:quercetin dioxygenase-like cupin family protein